MGRRRRRRKGKKIKMLQLHFAWPAAKRYLLQEMVASCTLSVSSFCAAPQTVHVILTCFTGSLSLSFFFKKQRKKRRKGKENNEPDGCRHKLASSRSIQKGAGGFISFGNALKLSQCIPSTCHILIYFGFWYICCSGSLTVNSCSQGILGIIAL